MNVRLLLASASPRRRELLAQIGLVPEALAPHINEERLAGEQCEACVRRLALAKARAVAAQHATAAVLGADTAVIIDDQMLGKPRDRADAERMWTALCGRTHEVLTAVALVYRGRERSALSRTEVTMRQIGAPERERYWASGEPQDKAGAYAIQGFGALFIERLAGSYSGVVGLPLFETAQLLQAAGIDCLPGDPADG